MQHLPKCGAIVHIHAFVAGATIVSAHPIDVAFVVYNSDAELNALLVGLLGNFR